MTNIQNYLHVPDKYSLGVFFIKYLSPASATSVSTFKLPLGGGGGH